MIAELPCFKPDTEYDLHSFVIDDSGNFWGFLCLGLFLGLPLVFIIGFFVWYFLSDPTLIIPNEQRTERGLNCDG